MVMKVMQDGSLRVMFDNSISHVIHCQLLHRRIHLRKSVPDLHHVAEEVVQVVDGEPDPTRSMPWPELARVARPNSYPWIGWSYMAI